MDAIIARIKKLLSLASNNPNAEEAALAAAEASRAERAAPGCAASARTGSRAGPSCAGSRLPPRHPFRPRRAMPPDGARAWSAAAPSRPLSSSSVKVSGTRGLRVGMGRTFADHTPTLPQGVPPDVT